VSVEFVRRVLDCLGKPKVGSRGRVAPTPPNPSSTESAALKEQWEWPEDAATVGRGRVVLGRQNAPRTVETPSGFDAVLRLVNGSARAVMILGGAGTG